MHMLCVCAYVRVRVREICWMCFFMQLLDKSANIPARFAFTAGGDNAREGKADVLTRATFQKEERYVQDTLLKAASAFL